jgi:hypothetical protein
MIPTTIRITPMASTSIPDASPVTPQIRIAPAATRSRETPIVMTLSSPAQKNGKP